MSRLLRFGLLLVALTGVAMASEEHHAQASLDDSDPVLDVMFDTDYGGVRPAGGNIGEGADGTLQAPPAKAESTPTPAPTSIAEHRHKFKYVVRRRRHSNKPSPWHIRAKQGSDMIKQTQAQERELKKMKVKAKARYHETIKKEKNEKRAAASEDVIFERHTKNADAILHAEKAKARKSEIQHKEAVQVHTKFITHEIAGKEGKQKRKEKATKAELHTVTEEINEKYRNKNGAFKPRNGGAFCTEGSFTMLSHMQEKEKAVKRANAALRRAKEMAKKKARLVKERKQKRAQMHKRVVAAASNERVEKEMLDNKGTTASYYNKAHKNEKEDKHAEQQHMHDEYMKVSKELGTKFSNFQSTTKHGNMMANSKEAGVKKGTKENQDVTAEHEREHAREFEREEKREEIREKERDVKRKAHEKKQKDNKEKAEKRELAAKKKVEMAHKESMLKKEKHHEEQLELLFKARTKRELETKFAAERADKALNKSQDQTASAHSAHDETKVKGEMEKNAKNERGAKLAAKVAAEQAAAAKEADDKAREKLEKHQAAMKAQKDAATERATKKKEEGEKSSKAAEKEHDSKNKMREKHSKEQESKAVAAAEEEKEGKHAEATAEKRVKHEKAKASLTNKHKAVVADHVKAKSDQADKHTFDSAERVQKHGTESATKASAEVKLKANRNKHKGDANELRAKSVAPTPVPTESPTPSPTHVPTPPLTKRPTAPTPVPTAAPVYSSAASYSSGSSYQSSAVANFLQEDESAPYKAITRPLPTPEKRAYESSASDVVGAQTKDEKKSYVSGVPQGDASYSSSEDPHAAMYASMKYAALEATEEQVAKMNAERGQKAMRLARETGAKKAIQETNTAKMQADKAVEEAENKEGAAKKTVKEAKAAVMKEKAAKAKKLLDQEKYGKAQLKPTKKPSFTMPKKKKLNEMTERELENILKKAKLKQKDVCKSARTLPGETNELKKKSDKAFVTQHSTEVMKHKMKEMLDDKEAKSYQKAKTSIYTVLKKKFERSYELSTTAVARCNKATSDADDLSKRVTEAKNSGFAKVNLPTAAFQFKEEEINKYPKCARIMGRKNFLRWLMMSDRGLRMSEKEHLCRIEKVDHANEKMKALNLAKSAAQKAIDTIDGSNRCVLQPAIIRMFAMLNDEDLSTNDKLQNFIKAVEESRKIKSFKKKSYSSGYSSAYSSTSAAPVKESPKAPEKEERDDKSSTAPKEKTPSTEFVFETDLAEARNTINSQNNEGSYRKFDNDGYGGFDKNVLLQTREGAQGVGELPRFDRLELGAALQDFEKQEIEGDKTFGDKVRIQQNNLKRREDLLGMKTARSEEGKLRAMANAKRVQAKRYKDAKTKFVDTNGRAKETPEGRYSCLYAKYQKAFAPVPSAADGIKALKAQMAAQASKASEQAAPERATSYLGEIQAEGAEGELFGEDMSEQEMSEITTIPTISSESFSTTAEDVAPFIQSNLNVEPFLKLKRMVEEFVDVGEGEGKKEGKKASAEDAKRAKSASPTETMKDHPSCKAFYKEHGGPNAGGAVEKNKPKPATPGRRLLGQPAQDSDQLYRKISSYVTDMAGRAASVAKKQLNIIIQQIEAANFEKEEADVRVKNAVRMVNTERNRQGSDADLQGGNCLGSSCFIGVTLQDTEAGSEVIWTCRRLLNLKYNTQLAFSCEMTARPGMEDESLHICTGKEVYMGDNVKFVPMLKEVTCPAEGPCVERKQCGSEGLPLKQSFIQKDLRNACAML